MKKLVIVCVLFFSFLSAAEKAVFNVITDLPTAKIYIDGVFAGVDAVQNYQVDAGEHYVMVQYNNKKIFAKTYAVAEGEIKTIPTAHFVDFKTNVASRGAVDVEAARIRETRGDFAIGIQASSSLSRGSLGGLSVKKWFWSRVGLQGFGMINNEAGGTKYQSGGRVLVWLADKVIADAPFSGYLFVGGGSDKLMNPGNVNENVARSISDAGFGVEFSPFGVNGLFMSLELGSERQYVTYSDPDKNATDEAGMVAAGGLHLYF